MSKIRLNGTTSGYTEIAPTAAAGNNVITAPTATGKFVIEDTSGGSGKVGIGTEGYSDINGNLHVYNSSAGSVSAAGDANELVLESATNVGMSFLTANDSIARIKFGDPDANNAGVIAYLHTDNSMRFHTTDGTERLRIESGGDIKIATGDLYFGTAGKGACFGVTSNTDSNTLDDYEEGTFNSTLTATDITLTSNTYTCYYTRIGRVVTINGYAAGTTPASLSGYSANTSHSLLVGNLPFNIINAVGARGAASLGVHSGFTVDNNHHLATHGTANSNSISVWQEPDSNGVRIGPTLFTSTAMTLHFSFTYQTT